VSRRIEIELTSARPDGSWTWRAAGAREPKGTLDGSLLHAQAKPGDVLRAEAEFELEGISIIAVATPKADDRRQPERIEVVGPARPDHPGVTTQLVGRADRRPGERRRDRDDGRPGRRDRDPARPQAPGRGREPGRDDGGQHRPKEGEERARREHPDRAEHEERRAREERAGRAESAAGAEGTDRTERPRRGPGETRGGDRPGGGRGRRPEGRPPSDRRRAGGEPEAPKARRFNPGSVHRQAVMESLPPEQRPIAEQVLRGGIPAVRTAIHLEREKAAAEGRSAPNADELIAMAEALLPRLKAAEWRDRAEAAAADPDGISLRDLRSVVAGADVARDEDTRALGANLREALERRVGKLHQDWSDEVAHHLDSGHVVRALRLSARPPEPSARLDAELSSRLADAAGEAMSSSTAPDLWAALLDAAAASPVRRAVKPAGLPEDCPPDLKRAAHQQSGSIPALAKLLGVTIPPPPQPVPARTRHRGRPAPAQGQKRAPRPAESRPAGSAGTTAPPPSAETAAPQPTPPPPPSAEAAEAEPTPPPTPSAETADAEPTPPPPPSGETAGPQATPPVPPERPGSAEGGEDPVVVEELRQSVDQTQVGDVG
jgi:hypothetical protein